MVVNDTAALCQREGLFYLHLTEILSYEFHFIR